MPSLFDDKILSRIDKCKINRSDWKMVSFGDIAIKQYEFVDLEKTTLTRYVTGKHIKNNDLHLREWEELTMVKNRIGKAPVQKFIEGDILYNSNRANLNKVAIAHFNGIAAKTIFVIKSNEEFIINEFLPFVMLSIGFAQHSTRNSKNTVTRNINWNDISSYEFLLPPIHQQVNLSELLLATDEATQKEIQLADRLDGILLSEIERDIHNQSLYGRTISDVLFNISKNTDMVLLKECGEIYKGKGIPKSAVVDNGVPCIRYGELYTHHDRIIRYYNSFIEKTTIPSAFKLKMNDVLFAGSGETITEIGKAAAFVATDEAYAGSDILVFRPHSMDGRFLGHLMNSQIVRQQLNKFGTGATVKHIYKSDLEKINIPMISLNSQIEIGKNMENYTQVIAQLKTRTTYLNLLQKNLINKLFLV